MGDDRPVLAVDIGGTKIAAALVDRGGRILSTRSVATPQGPTVTAEGLWRTVAALVEHCTDAVDGSGIAGAGIGCGGPMRWPEGVVSPLNIPRWRDFPLRDRFRELLPGHPVRVHNDAVCLTVGEHWRGAGRGKRNLLGMVVSTGVGGGLVVDGHLLGGASGNAGHVGHVVVDPDGPPCGCGGTGCLEAVARGPALVAWARGHGWRAAADASARELAHDAARGHPVALAAMRRAGRALGLAIASVTHLCDLQTVAVGGGLAQAGPLLFEPLEDSFRRHVRLAYAREVRVVPAALGQQAGLVGAAALVLAGGRYWAGH